MIALVVVLNYFLIFFSNHCCLSSEFTQTSYQPCCALCDKVVELSTDVVSIDGYHYHTTCYNLRECPICLELLANESWIVLNCFHKHWFHRSCLEGTTECPLCRIPLSFWQRAVLRVCSFLGRKG